MKKKENLDRHLGYKKATQQYMTSEMRALFREGLEHCLPNLISIGTGEQTTAPHGVQVRAADIIGKYAIGERPIMMFQKSEWLEIVARVTAKYITDPKTLIAWHEDLKACFVQQL